MGKFCLKYPPLQITLGPEDIKIPQPEFPPKFRIFNTLGNCPYINS